MCVLIAYIFNSSGSLKKGSWSRDVLEPFDYKWFATSVDEMMMQVTQVGFRDCQSCLSKSFCELFFFYSFDTSSDMWLYQMTKLATFCFQKAQLWNRQGWELEDTCLVGYWTCVEAYMGQGPMAHVSESQPLKHDHQTMVTIVWWSCLSLMFIFEAFGVMVGFRNWIVYVQESNMRFSRLKL